MARLLIPTRNRPESLRSVIAYLDSFHPDARVIIADGSSGDFAAQNKAAAQSQDLRIQIDYRQFSYELPFFDRILAVLQAEEDEFFIMGSDDDYPLMDALGRAEDLLRADASATTAMGATLKLMLRAEADLTAGLTANHTLRGKSAQIRAQTYAAYSFSTTYAVTRRSHLIERYQRAKEVFLPKFFDFGVGLHDVLAGNLIAVPEITFIATRNFNHTYLRSSDRFIFINRPAEFMTMLDQIQTDVAHHCALDMEKAHGVASVMLSQCIIKTLGGAPAKRAEALAAATKEGAMTAQVMAFFDLFTAGTPLRAQIEPRLRFVADALRAVATSNDNAGEKSFVDSLDAQTVRQVAQQDNKMFTVKARLAKDFRTGAGPVPNNVAVNPKTLLFVSGPPTAQPATAQPAPVQRSPARKTGLLRKIKKLFRRTAA